MEKAMYPSLYMRITQKDHTGSHLYSYAVDDGGSDSGIDYIIAPFTGTIKRIFREDANEVWLESNDKVLYADGTIDYMTVLFCHDNDISDLEEGQVIKQGEKFYDEGTKARVTLTGNHVHIECGKGKFIGDGWYAAPDNSGSINNGKKIDECLFIDDNYHILDDGGYNFKNVKDVPQEEQIVTNIPKLIFTAPKDDLYAINLKKGNKLFLE